MSLALYSYWRSSAAWRVRLALEVKGLKYQYRAVNLLQGAQQTPEYAKVNPQGLVPALDVGGKIVVQSLACIEYLEETHPEKPLLPKDPYQRALARGIALAVAADIHPLQNLRVMKKVTDKQEEREEWARHWIRNGLESIEKMLAQSAGKFCVGDEVTVADICLIPQVGNARRFKIDLEPFPRIRAIDERCSALPAFVAAHPNSQPDYVPPTQ